MELLISIALTALIFTFLYQSLHNVNKSNSFYKNKLNKLIDDTQLSNLLYQDILSSSNSIANAKLGTKDESGAIRFAFKTRNSIKSYINPIVTYLYYKKEKLLYRIESTRRMRFQNIEEILSLEYNVFKKIDSFSIYQNKNDFLIFFIKNKTKNFFQIRKLG